MTAIPDPARLDDLAAHAGALPGFDDAAARAAAARQASLTKPPGSLGRLEEIAVFVAGWRGDPRPRLETAQALVFAGNHGICAQGVNPFPQAVTAQMVANFQAGGAAINQICRVTGAALAVVALDLDRPTGDFTQGPAMGEDETLDAMRQGAAAVDPDADILVLGEMGIGNSTVAAALAAAVFGGPAEGWVGAGTGADDAVRARNLAAVEAGLARHAGTRGLHWLARIGGREQAAICGAVLEARARRIPVLLDGFICPAATAPLPAAAPGALDHCLAGHVSREPGHRRLLDAMGRRPVLDFDMALGEGSGAALALGVVRAALACHDGMATFAEAGVAGG
ncbi:nicotinate-nucleotide--dimethylbenzimidazole phosphoribosyltransferase [Rhodosalinus sp. FB01]|uniref:nicotinate-nucleotide--dimethylbenzimidazole phosphoribosyltransferase n=1 Tax=Rhodosalinus sp. FB01 TaxID=3239194 RepID=UPI00352360CE